MSKEIIKQEQAMTPGFGVAGLVMCPFFKGACLKAGCELFVGLNYAGTLVARCSLAWLSVLSTEIRQSIDKIVIPKTEEPKTEEPQKL